MTAYLGMDRETPFECDVVEIAPGVGQTVCFECNGDQERYRSLFPPELGVTHCVDCKGTGVRLINI